MDKCGVCLKEHHVKVHYCNSECQRRDWSKHKAHHAIYKALWMVVRGESEAEKERGMLFLMERAAGDKTEKEALLTCGVIPVAVEVDSRSRGTEARKRFAQGTICYLSARFRSREGSAGVCGGFGSSREAG